MNPVLLQTELLTIHTIWLFVAVGIYVGSYTVIKLSVKTGLKLQFLSDHIFKMILVSILGARIFFVLANFPMYFQMENPMALLQIFSIWDRGLSFFGGLTFALIYFYKSCKKKEQNFWQWLDAFTPAIIFGLAFGHIGSFFEGINYGHETSLPWGVNFESQMVKYTVPIHPTQIYAFIYSIIIGYCLVHIINTKSYKEKPLVGIVGSLGISIYAFCHFLEEFVRGDDVMMLFGIIRVSQIISFTIFIVFAILSYRNYKTRNEPASVNN